MGFHMNEIARSQLSGIEAKNALIGVVPHPLHHRHQVPLQPHE